MTGSACAPLSGFRAGAAAGNRPGAAQNVLGCSAPSFFWLAANDIAVVPSLTFGRNVVRTHLVTNDIPSSLGVDR